MNLMNRSRLLANVVSLTAICDCAPTMPMTVERSFGPGVKYEGRDSSFDWSPASAEYARKIKEQNPNLHGLIVETVESELAAKGYSRKTDGDADFHVAYALSRRDTADPWTMEPLTEGIIRLDLTDPETGNLIYRGAATITVDRTADAEQRRATMREAVKRMLEKFPARSAERTK